MDFHKELYLLPLGGSSQTSIEKIDISENLKNWYKETKKNGPTRKTTGKIVFGIKDGKWALISFDERLIYGITACGLWNSEVGG